MLSSTIFFKNKISSDTARKVGLKLSPYGDNINIFNISSNMQAVFNDNNTLISNFYYESADNSMILIGHVQNIRAIKEHFVGEDASITSTDNMLFIKECFDRYGDDFTKLLEGQFVLININHNSRKIRIFPSSTGQLPIFLLRGETNILTTEIKSVAGTANIKLKPLTLLKLREDNPNNHVVYENIVRLPSGAWSQLSNEGEYEFSEECTMIPQDTQISMSSSKSGVEMGNLLETSVRECLEVSTGDTYITLSSGLDSALITSLARNSRFPFTTCSIGTNDCNEFKGALETSTLLNVKHEQRLVDPDNWLDGIIDAVYYNEIFDGISAEIQSPLACLYKELKGKAGSVLSGYGADLLSAGMLDPCTDKAKINQLCAASIRRSLWTLEFSPFLASNSGIQIHHPFWTSKLIRVAMLIPSDVKIVNNIVKKFLRDWSVEHNVLPELVAGRKKLGIHEGAGVDAYFSKIVGSESAKDYTKKDKFIYQVFEKFFAQGLEREELNRDMLNKIISQC